MVNKMEEEVDEFMQRIRENMNETNDAQREKLHKELNRRSTDSRVTLETLRKISNKPLTMWDRLKLWYYGG